MVTSGPEFVGGFVVSSVRFPDSENVRGRANMFGAALSKPGRVVVGMSTLDTERSRRAETTTVTIRATGHVRTALGTHDLEFAFEGDTLREFLDAFLAEYDVADLLLAETEADATTRGWARPPDPEDLPGTWKKNPPGEQTRTYARVCVNGVFNEHLDGFDTELEEGDRVGLLYPFIFCC
jgi:molybdopterin converting factor small subunit